MIVTVLVFESTVPSFTLKVKLSGPLKFEPGVYVTVAVQA